MLQKLIINHLIDYILFIGFFKFYVVLVRLTIFNSFSSIITRRCKRTSEYFEKGRKRTPILDLRTTAFMPSVGYI